MIPSRSHFTTTATSQASAASMSGATTHRSGRVPVVNASGSGSSRKWTRDSGHTIGMPSLVSMSPTRWVAVPAATAHGTPATP